MTSLSLPRRFVSQVFQLFSLSLASEFSRELRGQDQYQHLFPPQGTPQFSREFKNKYLIKNLQALSFVSARSLLRMIQPLKMHDLATFSLNFGYLVELRQNFSRGLVEHQQNLIILQTIVNQRNRCNLVELEGKKGIIFEFFG